LSNFKGTKGTKPLKIKYAGDKPFSLYETGNEFYREIITEDKDYLDTLLANGTIDNIEEI
tara:strand:+ start:307 stop:486 length:180 start_codon:yes stop_codon:yes gene_type:complete